MGIVNLTDDSYFAESRCGISGTEAASARIGRLLEEGATILDLGACSTRPGSRAVGAEEEWRRLEPVLRLLARDFPTTRLSIDSYWSEVVEKAAELLGKPFLVNDISAGEDDPRMLETVARLGLPYAAMHKKGNPLTMQSLCHYDNIVAEVHAYFEAFASKAESLGIEDWILDPGFGFAKDVDQNWQLLGALESFRDFGKRILVGVSRKTMIWRLFGITPEESLPGTQAAHMAALERGADILRVHDVAEASRTVEIYRRIITAKI